MRTVVHEWGDDGLARTNPKTPRKLKGGTT